MSLDDVLSFLKQQSTAQCGAPIDAVIGGSYPDDYVEFLTQMNGFQWEGLFFYGLPLEDNLNLPEDLMLIGRSSDGVIFVYNKNQSCYCELDQPSLDEFERFESFFEMLSIVIKDKRELLSELGIEN